MAKVTPLSSTQVKNSLSNREVQVAIENGKVFKMRDGDGLHLRIRPNKSRSWVLDYLQPHTKKRLSISFGTYPSISLAEARELKLQAKALLAKDIDPKDERDRLNREETFAANNTFEAVCLEWFEIKKTKVKKNTAASILRKINKYLFPSLGKIPIKKIMAPEVIQILKPIAAKGILETNAKLIRYLNEIMNHAVNTGIIEYNPLTGLKSAFATPKTQNMPTIKPEELPELMRALSVSRTKMITRFLIEWQLHTMVRPGEAVKAKWSEMDLENKLWHIPAENMKKNRAHTVPLTEQTLNILASIKAISGTSDYLFPADRNPRTHANSSTANMAIKRMGFEGRLVAHGMRSIASTALNEHGFDYDVIETALAHIDKNEVRRAYNRAEYLSQRAEMMVWWSNFIDKASTGSLSLASTIQGLKLVKSA